MYCHWLYWVLLQILFLWSASRTGNTQKKWMPGYIFLDIFDCRRGKYQISKILWNSKISMMFKPSFCCHLYKSIQLLSLDKTLLGNFKCKIKICTAKLIHFIYINTALYVTLIISGKISFYNLSASRNWIQIAVSYSSLECWLSIPKFLFDCGSLFEFF